jgi:hypothetical protein
MSLEKLTPVVQSFKKQCKENPKEAQETLSKLKVNSNNSFKPTLERIY